MRGLDLALEESLNVRLVLIPDKEDPDSYVNKIGAEGFKKFIADNKKDFILFQLEISLKDAGSDSSKKSAIVNQIAETISKINKTEEFTRRQDYIKQVSEILRIEESGLNALVNKFIRDKVSKEESRFNKAPVIPDESTTTSGDEELLDLFNKDEMQEQAMVRSLIEFGMKQWNADQKVADFIFNQVEENELDKMIDNKTLIDIIGIYKKWYDEGLEPTAKNFLYHEDQKLHSFIINIMDVNTDISPNWKEHYEGHIPTREDLFKEEVTSTLNYLKLRKIKRMIGENQQDLEKATKPEDQLIYLQTHQHLKQMEIDLTREAGTVIYK